MNFASAANFPAPLDPQFQPAVLFNRHYIDAAKKSCRAVPLILGLERENGLVSRYETVVLPQADEVTALYVERLVKFLLWARGGWKLHIGGPKAIGDFIQKNYAPRGARKFDCDMMSRAYGKKFQVVVTTAEKVPAAKEMQVAAGGHLKGCRIGFDLGASDYKVSAVIDGEAVFTEEAPWDPKIAGRIPIIIIITSSPRCIAPPRICRAWTPSAAVRRASSWTMKFAWRRLLRAVPKKDFPKAAGIFKRIQREWNVPVVVMNDGDVTALAGALSLGSQGMLGIAMGSSQAAGFMDPQGRILGWLNELAFAPVDYQSRRRRWTNGPATKAWARCIFRSRR